MFAGAGRVGHRGFAQGSGFASVKAAGSDFVDGQPLKSASTNQLTLVPLTGIASESAPPVVPASCAAPPSTAIHRRYPIASGTALHWNVTLLPLGVAPMSCGAACAQRSEGNTSELQARGLISDAAFGCEIDGEG